MLKVYNISELMENADRYNRIVCFGVGGYFEKTKSLLENTKIWKKICYVTDNDKGKQGTYILFGEKKLRVMCLTEIMAVNFNDNDAVLVTPYFYTDILKQLATYDAFRGMDIICMAHIFRMIRDEYYMNVSMPSNLRITQKPVIPKVIHYCWFGGGEIPDQYKHCMESWHKFCPDYKIIKWNEDNYDVTKNKYMKDAYERRKWAFVPDYARLDIVFNYGGIYLDTDVEVVQNIDDLLYQKGFAGFETENFVALGLGFGAVKNLPIIKKMRDMYEDIEFVLEDGSIDLTASPVWQTRLMKEYGLKTNGEYQMVGDMVIYPVKVLNGRGLTEHKNSGLYPKSIHHYELSSWQEKKYIDLMLEMDRDMETYYFSENKE